MGIICFCHATFRMFQTNLKIAIYSSPLLYIRLGMLLCSSNCFFAKLCFFWGGSLKLFLSLCFALLVSVFSLAFFAHMWFRSVCFCLFFNDCMNSTQAVWSFQFSFGLLSYAVQTQIWFLLMRRLHKQTEFIWFFSHWSCSHNCYIIAHQLSAVVDKGKYGGSQQWQLKKGGCKFNRYLGRRFKQQLFLWNLPVKLYTS